MLVVIGDNLINPEQIVSIQNVCTHNLSIKDLCVEGEILHETPKIPKRVVIAMSNGDYFTYDAGKEGYAAACKLRDDMLDHLYA